MTLMEQIRSQRDTQPQAATTSSRSIGAGGEQQDASQQSHSNVGTAERAISVAAGSIVAIQGLSRGSLPGLICAAIGGALIYRGATGSCPMYRALNIDTANPQATGDQAQQEELDERGIEVEQAFLINRPAQELYDFWRNFENLPTVMKHLKSVTRIDDRKSHWVAEAPRIAGGTIEWDAEIAQDVPGERIEWRSVPGSAVDTVGEVQFIPAVGDRGTEVHVNMLYVPPAGKLGHWLATVFGTSPRRQIREDLRNFKRMMETGEIATVQGQPRGTCTGQGKREGE